MFAAKDSTRKTSTRASQPSLDEFARLHDSPRAPSILSEHIDVNRFDVIRTPRDHPQQTLIQTLKIRAAVPLTAERRLSTQG
jgi:hypothetical protein